MSDSDGAEIRTGPAPERSPREEVYNSLTHFFGFGLSIAGAIALLPIAISQGPPRMVLACFIYSFALMAVFLSSALSHTFSVSSKRLFFRSLDQSFIYVLIVASWTPFSIAFLPTAWWNGVLVLMWLIAVLGFTSKIFLGHRVDRVSIWIYLALGWTPGLGGMLVTPLLPNFVLGWIMAGGAFYTLGTLFLFADKKSIWFHPVWHLSVLAGAATHYFAILWYVV